MADLDRDIAIFESMQTELERNHMGKWVLFHNEELIDLFNDFETAAETAVGKFGAGPYLIRQIGAPPVTLPASVMYHPAHGQDDTLRLRRFAEWQGK